VDIGLRSKDFFAAEHDPLIMFNSASAEKVTLEYAVISSLTIFRLASHERVPSETLSSQMPKCSIHMPGKHEHCLRRMCCNFRGCWR
jgi:hypothetical protein